MDNVKTFALCWRMALKDGQLSCSEKAVLDTIAEELELTPTERLAARKVLGHSIKASDFPQDLLEREGLIRQMIRVGWADNVIQPSEEMFLVKVGEAMSMDLGKINKIVDQLGPGKELVQLNKLDALKTKDFEAYMVADQARLREKSPGLFDFDDDEEASAPTGFTVAIILIVVTTVLGGFLVSTAGPFVFGVLTDSEMWQTEGYYAQIALVMVFVWWVLAGLIGSIVVVVAASFCLYYFYVGLRTFIDALKQSDRTNQ
ncbi:MAG: hypothetical protein P1V97_07080 [Planctomycetota bacterium]|nr:hypothetical protein [Planctomycetota bacterium]